MRKEASWLYHLFVSLSAFALHHNTVDTLVVGNDKLQELQQRYPEKPMSELREMMSPYLQRPPLRTRIKQKIERVKAKINSANFTRKKDKWTFTIGLLRILAEFYLLGKAPCYYPLWHTFWAAVLLSARVVYYRLLRYHYFLFDFCYYANSFVLLFLWVWNDSEWLFGVTWAYSVGPLLFAVPLYNNMIVLQHIDKTTSNFIHFSPALTMWAVRWWDCASMPVTTTTPGFFSFYLPAMGMYLIWAVLYYLIIFVITFQRCQAKHNLTLYTWMMEDSKAYAYRWSGAFGEALRPLIFMLGHLTVFSVGIVVSYIAMVSFVMNTALLMWIGVISVWNASGYYMEYFAKDYEKKLAELKEMSKQK